MAEQPSIQPGTPPERPIFNPEALKEEIAGKGVKEKIDTLNEALEAVKKAKENALKDIEADIARVYPNNPAKDDEDEENKRNKQKRDNEKLAVEKMLSRLEAGYLQAAKESKAEIKLGDKGLYEFQKLVDEYFAELLTITGDTNPEEGKIDFSTVDPYEFWKNTAGWYEKAEDEKAPGTESFKEEKIEKEGERWWDAIRTFQALDKKGNPTNRIKKGEEENFQNWIETHREDLRRIILRQIADRKYIIDFANLTGIENPTKEDIDAAIAGSASKASFIAKNIGLADLFADISQAITVWKGDKLYTGQINADYSRKNGLKGGYFYNDGKDHYLEIWHGAVISTNPADQIAKDEKDFLPDEMFEAPKEDELEITQQKGGRVINFVYKPGVDENDTPNENLKVIIKENTEKRQKELDKESSGSFKLNYSYEKLYEVDTIKKQGETTFELKTKTPDYSNINNEIIYESKEFPNIEIVIPFSKNSGYLLRVKTQRNNTEEKKVVVYEFADIESLKEQLGKEVEIQEKSPQNSIPKEDVKTMELSESCSAEVVKSQIKKAKERYTKDEKTSLARIIIKGEVPTELEPQDENEKTKITIKNSELTEEGAKKLPIDSKVTNVNIETGENLSKESLDIVLSKTPNATRLSLKGAKDLYKGALFTVASRLNKTLEELDLTYSAVHPENLQYLDSCTKLKDLKLGYTTVDDFAVETYVSKLAHLESLELQSTSITDKSLESLAKLEKLTSLDLRGTDTSFKATIELKRKLPGCNIKMSERAERELDEYIREKLDEIAKKQEPKLAEDINQILLGGGKDLSVQNTNFDPEKQSMSTDVYFEKEKIASAELTMEVTDEKDDKVSLKDLCEDLAKAGTLYTKPKTEEVSGNKLKHKVTIGEKVIYIEKKYEFSELDKDNKKTSIKTKDIAKKIDKAKKEKTGREYTESLYEDPSTIARTKITELFPDKTTDINFEKTKILRDKKTIRGKISYKEEVIGLMDIKITDAEKRTTTPQLLDDDGGETNQAFMLTRIKNIDDRKKAEETAKAAQEANEKLNAYRKETIETLDSMLGKIDKNLKIGKAEMKDSTAEQGRKYFDLQVIYFGETIGKILPWADVDFKNQADVDIDIWIKLETDKSFEQIKEGNLQERLEKLKEKALEKRKEQKIEEFKKFITGVQNKKNQNDDSIAYTLELDEENIKTKETAASRPYIEIKVSETMKSSNSVFEATTSKDIGFISAYLAGESEIYIQNMNREDVGGNTPEEKILGISYKFN